MYFVFRIKLISSGKVVEQHKTLDSQQPTIDGIGFKRFRAGS
jgi:hypothetical protein